VPSRVALLAPGGVQGAWDVSGEVNLLPAERPFRLSD